MLPKEEAVTDRNKAITSIYAQLYQANPNLYKWAGMTAFASHHVGLGLIPFKISGIKLLNIKTSFLKTGLIHHLNLVRHLNNRIFEDIDWVHFAYAEHGIDLLRTLMTNHPHYQKMLDAFELLEDRKLLLEDGQKREGENKIWRANLQLLKHDQQEVVQPVFNKLGASFKNILTYSASLDFNPSHTKTDWKYRSSFILYFFAKGKKSCLIPNHCQI